MFTDQVGKACASPVGTRRISDFGRREWTLAGLGSAERFSVDEFRNTKIRVDIPTANAKAREFVDCQWQSLSDRLHVVAGKILLATLRGRLQEQHGVSFGNERLAEAFTEDEVPLELRDAMAQIAGLAAA